MVEVVGHEARPTRANTVMTEEGERRKELVPAEAFLHGERLRAVKKFNDRDYPSLFMVASPKM